MSEQGEVLEVSVVGDAQPLDRFFSTAADIVDRGLKTIERAGDGIASALDRGFSGGNQALGELRGDVGQTNSLLTMLIGTINKLGGASGGVDKIQSAVAKVNAELKAGIITQEQAKGKYKDIADAAEANSRTQLAALGRIRDMEQAEAREAERIADRKVADANKVAAAEVAATQKAEKAQEELNRTRARTQNRMVDGALSGMGNAGRNMTIGVTAPVIYAAKKITDAAGDQNEAVDLATTVFKKSAPAILEWSKTTANAFAVSRTEALQTAGTFGAYLQTVGEAEGASAKLSQRLVKMGADFASLYNTDTDQAMNAIRSGLNGEEEPLRKFGVRLSAVRIEAEAFASGIVKPTQSLPKLHKAQLDVAKASADVAKALKSHGEGSYEYLKAVNAVEIAEGRLSKAMGGQKPQLTALQKMRAAYNIIIKDGKIADDNYNQTRNSLNNTEKRAQKIANDEASKLGQELLPLKKQLLLLTIQLLQQFNKLTDEQKKSVLVFIGLAAAAGPLLTIMSGMGRAFVALGTASKFLDAWKAGKSITDAATAATNATTEVGKLSTGLQGLKAFSTIAIAIGVAITFYKIGEWIDEKTGLSKMINENNDTQADIANAHLGNSTANDAKTALKWLRKPSSHPDGDIQQREADWITQMMEQWTADNPRATARQRQLEQDRQMQKRITMYERVTKMHPDLALIARNKAKAKQEAAAAKAAAARAAAAAASKGGNKDDDANGPDPFSHIPAPAPKKKKPVKRSFPDLPKIPKGYILPANLEKESVNPDTYEAKLAVIEGHYARLAVDAADKGKPFDKDASNIERLRARVKLGKTAVYNTRAQMDMFATTFQEEERVAAEKRAEFEKLRDSLSKQQGAGKQITDAQMKEYNKKREDSKKATAKFTETRGAYDTFRRTNEQATNTLNSDQGALADALADALAENIRKQQSDWMQGLKNSLKNGKIDRNEFDATLQAVLMNMNPDAAGYNGLAEMLAESETARENATRETQQAIARLNKRDADLARQEVDATVVDRRNAGVAEPVLQQFKDASYKQIDKDEFDRNYSQQDEKFKADMADGMATLQHYRAFLVDTLKQAESQFGATSEQASKLSVAINHVDWDIAEEGATKLHEALDNGDISIYQYLAGLEAIRNTLSSVSPEYKKLSSEMQQIHKRMRDEANQTANDIGGKFADGIVSAFRKTKSLTGALKDVLRDIEDEWLRDMAKRIISRYVLKVVQKDTGDKMKEAVQQQDVTTNKFVEGIGTFGTIVGAFVEAVNSASTGIAPGGGGEGAAAPGGGDSAWWETAINTATGGANAVGAISGAKNGVDKFNAIGNVVKNVTGAQGQGNTTRAVKDAANMAASVATNKVLVGAKFAGAASAAMPYVAAGLLVMDLLSSSGVLATKYRGFDTKNGESAYRSVGRGDHTGLIDSGFSGVDGLRSLRSAYDAGQARQAGTQPNVHVGSITVNALPQHDTEDIANMVVEKIASGVAMQNSLMGNR